MTGPHVDERTPRDFGELADSIPELLALLPLTENNDWHHDDAYHQALRLRDWVVALPDSLQGLISVPQVRVSRSLQARIDLEAPRVAHELLAFATLIHDVGKATTFLRNEDSTTRCPGHEEAGAEMARSICARFGFTSRETDFITHLVRAHGEPYALFKRTSSDAPAGKEAAQDRFAQEHRRCFLSLLLLAIGDVVTSNLAMRKPHKYAAVLSFYSSWLERSLEEA